MRACPLCKGVELGPKPIFQLDERVTVSIVGQAPRWPTHAKNRPFDDPFGDRLRGWLGVDRTKFYEDKRIEIFPMGLIQAVINRQGRRVQPRGGRQFCRPSERLNLLWSLDVMRLLDTCQIFTVTLLP